jgi:nitrate reductase (NAD(P)H)
MAQVAQHNTEADCWIIVAGKVYDTTAFNKSHPGGGSSIFINAGTDTTEEFEAIHSKRAWSMLDEWYIGDLAPASADAPLPPPTPQETQAQRTSLDLARAAAQRWDGPMALDPKKRLPFKLLQRTELNHNTRLLRFALQSPQHVLGLPVGQHVFVSASIDGRLVMRAYTPVSVNADKSVFDLLIKVYFKGTDPEFPLGGAMSQHLDSLREGDTVDVKGPLGHIAYLGRGAFDISSAKVRATRVAMIAGGTGITPMFQLIRAMLDDAEDTTRIWLLYANRSEEDILLGAELGALAAAHPARFTLVHTLSRPRDAAAWTGSTGRVSAEMVAKHLPPARVEGDAAGDSALAFLCGPGGMQDSCYRHLYALGYPDERVLTF